MAADVLHVFIDTNILLRFYAYSDDALAEVEKLSALVKAKKINLLITEQIVDEHARNRDSILAESMKRLEQMPTAAQLPRFAEHYDAAKAVLVAMNEAKSAKTALVEEIRKEMAEGRLRADRVILDMFAATTPLPRTDEIIRRAKLRRELGNPPGKPDSLGDQINWEVLIEHVPEGAELHVISKDGDFRTGAVPGRASFFLRGEWNYKKKATLHLYNGLAEFTKQHFPNINVPSDAIKSAAIENFINSGSFAQTHAAVADLNEVMKDLTAEEAITVLNAATENGQISSIARDSDVFELLQTLHLRHFFETPTSLDSKLEALLGPIHERESAQPSDVNVDDDVPF